MKKLINTIDLWSMDDDAVEILVPAIYDEFECGGQLYNQIKIYENSDISYLSDGKTVNSYHHTILFLINGKPVRIVFLRNCDINKTVKEVFDIKCLPNNKSVNDLAKQNKVVIDSTDLKQKTGNVIADKQYGSCDRLRLLVQMLGGAITADGSGEKMKVGNLEFDQNFVLVVKADLKEFDVCIKHRGAFKLNQKRWIMLQE